MTSFGPAARAGPAFSSVWVDSTFQNRASIADIVRADNFYAISN